MKNRGSEWRKWDLHFHTPSSYDYKDKSISNEKIIEILKENEIKVVAITDHHLIDVARIIELQRLGIDSEITVLPGIEFRAELGGSESIHYIGIFSEKLNEQQLNDIWIKLQSTCKITKTDINNIGGDAYIQCDFKETTNLIHELGGLVTVHAGTKANTFENITNSLPDKMAQKTELVRGHIDIFELGKEIDQISYNEKVFPHLGFRVPMIICSDNHKITEYILKQNLWIKADPTFEGLKQIIYEPKERVKIQREEPESEKLDNLMIKEVSFESSNNKFTIEPIKLNKNLNVIIGGKSSGKSILLYKIAKTLYANTNDDILKYKDSEDGKTKDLYDLDSYDSSFNFNVELFSGSCQSLRNRQTSSSILPSIKYIPQNHLSNLVDKSRKNGATLKELIRNLILEDITYKKKYDDFVDVVKKNDEQRNRDIEYYFSLKDEIKKKESELSSRGDTKSLQEGINANKKKIDLLSKSFTDEDLKKYNALVAQKNQSSVEQNTLNLDYEKIKNYNADLKRVLTEQLSKKRIVIDSINTTSIKEQFEQKYKFIEKTLEEINSIEKDLLRNDQGDFLTDSELKKTLNNIKSKNLKLDNDLKPFIEKQENSIQIDAIQKSISNDETKLSEIKQFQSEVETKKKSLSEQKNKIFNDFKTNYKEYDKIINELTPRISSIKGQDDKVEIIGSVKYNYPKFYRIIDSMSDKRSFNTKGFEYLYNDEKTALSQFDFEQIIQSLKNLFDRIEENNYILISSNQPKEACKKIMTDFFYDHWDVISDKDDIHKMSTGKASFILLKLMIKLSREKGPILIDQPEDNLDNRSVSKELVEYLKEKKTDRQIILVTHNPNIVVNADAENIIVANQKGQNDILSESPYTFDYINGALENTFVQLKSEKDLLKSMGIREHIAEIVEGGKEAFKKREEKYGF
ncbi:TrlF family AAA-like ATPase [Flavobacterium sp.]|uniref:TrlF family AAA-like ATPase n=1 Tax=Flavobacterium sp. TaxID=239 RepID=UPI002B4AEF83|nr:hypothetical protein [Flavobacterium sp.]HLP65491.1 hypothetical protein [Flavobacterium sp.]